VIVHHIGKDAEGSVIAGASQGLAEKVVFERERDVAETSDDGISDDDDLVVPNERVAKAVGVNGNYRGRKDEMGKVF
jgi:hypothetical protein